MKRPLPLILPLSASLSWRELFTDSHLQTLIEHALQSNTDLLSAQQRIKEAEATLSSAKLAYLPSFMLTPQGGVSRFRQVERFMDLYRYRFRQLGNRHFR